MRKLSELLKKGKIAVVRTDTLYGILGLAKDPHVVDRIYKIKGRDELKPVVVLVADCKQIEGLGLALNDTCRTLLGEYWPGPVSVILPVKEEFELHYLHKGTGGIAFRIPDDEYLLELLKETGPLVAPSANPQGKEPAKTIKQAMDYFGSAIDFYDDRGECTNTNCGIKKKHMMDVMCFCIVMFVERRVVQLLLLK